MLALACLLIVFPWAARSAEKGWTLLVYLGGDRALEANAIDDFNALERGLDSNACTVVVQIDRIPGYDTSNGDWQTCRRYLLQYDPNSDRTIRSTLIQDIGEVNMGDGQTLADFLAWGMQTYPAKRVAVLVWGSATPMGICPDTTSGNDALNVLSGELTAALAQVTAAAGRRIDLYVAWGCNYGTFEHDYVIREYADATARSQLATWNAEGSATDILTWLSANPTASARQFASAWVDRYTDYAVFKGRCTGWAAIDLGPAFVRLGLAMDTFARELLRAGGRGRPEIAAAVSNTVYSYALEFDMCHFARNIAGTLTLPQPLRAAAQAVISGYGYPPSPGGSPLINFRFVEGTRAPGERWPTGNAAELRGTKIYQRDYAAFESGAPPSIAYDPFKRNNAWKWFLAGKTNLPAELLLTYDTISVGETIPASGAPTAFTVTLRNSGGAPAQNVSARLSCTSAYAVATDVTSTFPDIPSEVTGSSQNSFSVTVGTNAPAGCRIWLWLEVTANGGYTNTTTFCLESRCETLMGTPIVWMREHGFTNDFDHVDVQDVDHDGMATCREWVSDTDPTNAASVLRVTSVGPGTNGALVSWQGGTAAWQYVERHCDLGATGVSWAVVFTNRPPTTVTNITDAGGTNPAQFYRIRAERK